MICKNCEYNFSGNFCNNCGQSSNVRKVDFKYLLDEIPNGVFQLNRGILFTLKQLFTRPGHSIREFLEGKRKPYYRPIAFLLIISTLYVLSAFLFDKSTFIDMFLSGWERAMINNNENSGFDILKWISRNQAYITLLFIPVFSLASYVAFLKSKFNYFEHLVLNTYITAQQMIIYFIFSFVFFEDNILLIIPYIIGVIYNFWTFHQFFKDKKTLNKIWLLLLTYIILLLEIMIIMFITAGIFVLNK
ncbi:DUF3667 domain-containing protein [Ancylomarina sp. YFZ004]